MTNEHIGEREGQLMNGRAKQLAVRWHAGITRKVGGEPYITHLEAVAGILEANGFPASVVRAGWCHDLLEDTGCTEQEIVAACGEETLEIVKAVSHDGLSDWRGRKERYIAQVGAASPGAKAVCCADKIHNAQSLLREHQQLGRDVWSMFNAGRADKLWFERAVLTMLQETWNHPLVAEYANLVEQLEQLD